MMRLLLKAIYRVFLKYRVAKQVRSLFVWQNNDVGMFLPHTNIYIEGTYRASRGLDFRVFIYKNGLQDKADGVEPIVVFDEDSFEPYIISRSLSRDTKFRDGEWRHVLDFFSKKVKRQRRQKKIASKQEEHFIDDENIIYTKKELP